MYYTIYFEDDFDFDLKHNPFNLKNDLKKLNIKYKNKYTLHIRQEIQHGTNRTSCKAIFKIDYNNTKYKIMIVKIRCGFESKGKSGGIRFIVLVDEKNMICIVLHAYGKNKTEELTENEKNSLKKLLDYYKESIEGEENNE